MSKSKELKKIKKIYGEEFMHLCGEAFQPILEEENLLYNILVQNFSDNCRNIRSTISRHGEEMKQAFIDYIYSKAEIKKAEIKKAEIIVSTGKTPYQLLEEAGYDLFECTTPQEVRKFERYYAEGEVLCTFDNPPKRLGTHVVFFAVKKDADKIKRENFSEPQREDEYSTSVLGIQFNRTGTCRVSIKSRYNHVVTNPDNTYRNDLDRIIPGLASSFTELLQERGFSFDGRAIEDLGLPGYILAEDGKYYEYNIGIGRGLYCCPKNIVIRNNVPEKIGEPEQVILMDNFALDLTNKKITCIEAGNEHDSFVDGLQNIEQIIVERDVKKGTRIITLQIQGQEEPAIIEIDKTNQIIAYKNSSLTEVGSNFMKNNRTLRILEIPNVTKCRDNFLMSNRELTEFVAPKLIEMGHFCLYRNNSLQRIDVQSLENVGDNFMRQNNSLTEFVAPNLNKLGNYCLYNNVVLERFEAPRLKTVGDDLLRLNKSLIEFIVPNLTRLGNHCLYSNTSLQRIDAQSLERVGNHVLECNRTLQEFNAPNLSRLGTNSLKMNAPIRNQIEQQIARNTKRNVSNTPVLNIPGLRIFSGDIASLDRNANITSNEVENAQNFIVGIVRTRDVDKTTER